MRLASCALLILAGCGPDPCASPAGDPTLVIGGASSTDLSFETFVAGDPRELVLGPQGGMHVWLHARISGICPDTAVLERRVVDDASGAVYQFGRGPVDFVASAEPNVFELTEPLAMILCPEAPGRPVLGQRLRFVTMVIDDQSRTASAELAFVATCPAGVDCAAICTP
jgi:hypothetical protein